MTQTTSRGTGYILCLLVILLLFLALLELSKHTLAGFILALVCTAIFIALRLTCLTSVGRGVRFLSFLAFLLLLTGIYFVSKPPVKLVPATEKSGGVTSVRHVSQGDLTGVYTEDKAVEIYTGIPYAQPPVGDLRWREPQESLPWEGVLRADHFAPMSMQTRSSALYSSLSQIVGYHDYAITLSDNYLPPASEDSLYCNIWKPAGDVSNLPVLVYVHGGSLQTGQPWYADYSGEGLARKGAVVVNFGYRLGIFGFFADPALAEESPNGTTGNYGLLDQIMLLKWVQENIAAFGGDPTNVTLAGESAGSACVSALCTSPLAKGLFRRVLAESSTVTAAQPAHSFRTLEEAYQAGEDTKKRLGVSSLSELRALSAEAIVSELASHHHMTVDGYVLPETPYASYARGVHNEEAQFHGYNLDESAPFILFSQASMKDYESKVRAAFPAPFADEVLALFPAQTDTEARRNWADIYTAVLFTYGHEVWRKEAVANDIPAYIYYFTKQNGRLSAWHSGEEVYIYGNIPGDSKLYTDEDRALSRQMTAYLLNFMQTGDPNGEGLPAWEKADDGEARVMLFGNSVEMTQAPYTELYAILDSMYTP